MKQLAIAIVALAVTACQAGPGGSLATGQNSRVIQGMYDSFAEGDITAVADAMAPDIEWTVAENYLYADGNPYIGPNAVVEGVFSRLSADWSGFKLAVSEIFESGDRVVALGRYTGRHNATGARIDAQFAHVWRLDEGKVVSFQQYTDTFQIATAAAAGGRGKAKAAVAKGPAKGPAKPAQAAPAKKAPAKKKPKSGR